MERGLAGAAVPKQAAPTVRRAFAARGSAALVATLIGVGAILAFHAAHYWPYFSDDAFISLRYAKRFAEGEGLTWTSGERVEGYTDLLWVLILGAFGKLGADYLVCARVLGFLGVLGGAMSFGFSPATGRFSAPRAIIAAPLLVLSAPLAIWAIGGLEHGFMAGVLGLAFFMVGRRAFGDEAVGRRDLLASLPLAALSLLRADGVVLSGSIVAGACLAAPSRSTGLRRAIVLGLPTAVAVISQLVFRRLYYSAWQPNTALAKVAFTRDRFLLGLAYVQSFYGTMFVLLAFALVATFLLARLGKLRDVAIPWTTAVLWSLYQISVGGDIFPGYRQLVFPVVAFVAIVATSAEHMRPRPTAWLGIGAGGLLHVLLQMHDPENARARDELWEWDGLPIATALANAFGARDPLMAVDAAGALPYWSNLRSLDMLGLTDRYIAEHPPPTFGTGAIGHELGNGPYVWSRRPDIVAFGNAAGKRDPVFLSGHELIRMPEFHRDYQWIRILGTIGNRSHGEVWLRREGGKVGIERGPAGVTVPGYFFTGQASSAGASVDARGKLVAYVSNEKPGQVVPFTIGPGRFRVRHTPAFIPFTVSLRCDGRAMRRVFEGSGRDTVLDLDRPIQLGVAVASPLGTQPLESFAFEVTDAPPTFECTPPGLRLRLGLAEVAHKKREGMPWDHPGSAMIQRAGLSVQLGEATRAKAIELSVDNDDTYVLELLLDGRPVPFSRDITSRTSIPGLAVHRLPLAPSDAPDGFDEILLTPRTGDGNFSMGHLLLER